MAAPSIQKKRFKLIGLAGPLLGLSWPTIVTFSVLAVRSLVDVWLVGRLGVNDLAAIAPAHLVMGFFVSFGFGSLYAVNSFVSHAKGANQPAECGRYAWQGIWHSAIYGIVIGIAGFYGAGFFEIFGHAPAIVDREYAYFRIAVLSVFPQLAAFAAVNFFFGIERPLVPMIMAIGSVLLHSMLGYGLVLGNWGLPKLEIAGAGWALVGSSSLHAIVLIGWFLLDPRVRKYGTLRIILSFRRLRDLWRVGVPVGLRDLLDILVWGFAFIFLIGKLGAVPLAAASVLLACLDVLLLPCDGLGAALVTVVGRSLGGRNPGRADSWRQTAMLLMTGYGLLTGLGFFLFRIPILGFLAPDPEVFGLSNDLAFFIPILILLYSWNIVFEHALIGAGDNWWPAIVNVLLTVIILGVGGFFLVNYFQTTHSYGVWILICMNIGFVVAALWWRWESGAWRERRMLE